MKIPIENTSRQIIAKALKEGVLDLNTIAELSTMIPEKIQIFNNGMGGVLEPNSVFTTYPLDRTIKVALLTALSAGTFVVPESLLKHIDSLKGVEPFLELMKSVVVDA